MTDVEKPFFPTASQRADLIAAGWKPPMQSLPTRRRFRVEVGADGTVQVFDVAVPVHPQARATAIVTLVDGVFDAGWTG